MLSSGATSLQQLIPPEYLDIVLSLYNRAVVETWYLSLAMACASIIGVVGIEWIHVNPMGANSDLGIDTGNETMLQDTKKTPKSEGQNNDVGL